MRIAHICAYTAYMAMSAFLRSDKGGKAGQPATSSKLHCKATLQSYIAKLHCKATLHGGFLVANATLLISSSWLLYGATWMLPVFRCASIS